MTTYTVYVYGIFTRGAISSENADKCRERFLEDIRIANQVWKIEEVSIIHFVPGETFFSPKKINADSMTASQAFRNGGPVDSLIQQTKRLTNNESAIYVVYVNGGFFAGGRRTVGVAIPDFEDVRTGSDYKLFGHIALTDNAAGTYTFAHEVGHILFTRYHFKQNQFISDDPSGPFINPQTGERDYTHNNDRHNLMYPTISSNHPILTPQQCQRARQSKILIK